MRIGGLKCPDAFLLYDYDDLAFYATGRLENVLWGRIQTYCTTCPNEPNN